MPGRLGRVAPLLVCAALGAGCGGSSSNRPPPSGTLNGVGKASSPAGADRVVVVINGNRWDVRQSGSESVTFTHAPQMNHSGPLGCRGRYFDINQLPLVLRYTDHDASVLYGDHIYHFGVPPRRRGGALVWSGRFIDARVQVRVQCASPAGAASSRT
jgi:hypothetical protein